MKKITSLAIASDGNSAVRLEYFARDRMSIAASKGVPNNSTLARCIQDTMLDER
jgi:hypothetical protein